jgi:3-hydroxybutyrate dehydrogenase
MLKGKVAVITGATSGIGLGLAHAFAGAGCAIEINGFAASVTEIGELVDGLEQRHGVRVVHYPADLAHPSQCVGLIEDAQQRFGRMDILINNAGIQHVAPVESFPPEQWDAILAVNLSAAFHLTRCALPGMQRREYGRILNVASVHGLVGSIHKAAYVAAKHGLIGLTKVVALENAARGITCNAICPGFVSTPLVHKQIEDRARQTQVSIEEALREMLREKQPSERFVNVEDITALALFLCSDAGASITGASLPIDGGWTAV